MAPGAFSVPFRRAPELEALLEDYDHIQFYWGETLIATGVYFRSRPQRGLLMAEGALLPWWLGVDKEGPLIELARYRSGVNKLSNGQFELKDLYWAVGEDSQWLLGVGAGMGGGLGAKVNPTNPGDDDFIVSEESFEAFSGDTLRLRMWMRNTDPAPTFNRLHTRVVFDGRFGQPSLLPAEISSSMWRAVGDGAGFSTADEFARTPPALAYVGATPKAQFVRNGSFESGSGDTATDWTPMASPGGAVRDSTTPHSGSWSMKLPEDGAQGVFQTYDGGTAAPDDEFVLVFWAAMTAGATSALRVVATWSEDAEIIRIEPPGTGWRRYEAHFTAPSDFDPTSAWSILFRPDSSVSGSEFWRIDQVTITRIRGNRCRVETANTEDFNPFYRGDFIKVIPGYSYTIEAWFRSEASCSHGEGWIEVLTREQWDDGTTGEEYHTSLHVGLTHGVYTRVAIEVTPSSGKNWMKISCWGQDVYGGGMHVDDVTCRLTDNNVRPVDSVWDPITDPDGEIHNMDVTVPRGARFFHVEIGVEAHGANWEIDDVKLLWTGPQPITTPEAIASAMASAACLIPGTIHAAGNIAFDWNPRNMMAREVLDELCRTGLVSPQREWRVNPDGTLDWGTTTEIFADRSGTVVLVEGESWLIDEPSSFRSMELFATNVKVIGAERNAHRGHHSIVRTLTTGRATNPAGTFMAFDGSPFARTRLEENGSVDTQSYADAFARDVADSVAVEHESYDLQIADWKTLGGFDVGDWIGVAHPSNGIEDVARPLLWEGRTIYPKKLRVISREWTLGSGPFRVVLRRSPPDMTAGWDTGSWDDGFWDDNSAAYDVIDVSEFVEWPAVTRARIEVGDKRPEFIANPQGGPLQRQYMRYRTALRNG